MCHGAYATLLTFLCALLYLLCTAMPFVKKKGLSCSATHHHGGDLGLKKFRLKGLKQMERQALTAVKRAEVIAGE